MLLFFGCTSINATKTTGQSSHFKDMAIMKLGENPTYKMNGSKTYVLCIKDVKGTAQQPRNSLSFIVIKLDDNNIALEQKFEGGTVGWYSDHEVEVFRTPGIVQKDQSQDDFTTIYNVVTGKSYPKKGKELN
jgi:hypothetical protein